MFSIIYFMSYAYGLAHHKVDKIPHRDNSVQITFTVIRRTICSAAYITVFYPILYESVELDTAIEKNDIRIAASEVRRVNQCYIWLVLEILSTNDILYYLNVSERLLETNLTLRNLFARYNRFFNYLMLFQARQTERSELFIALHHDENHKSFYSI